MAFINFSENDASCLLDFNQKLNVPLLDCVVESFYSSHEPQHSIAKKVMQTFSAFPEAWRRVDAILEYSNKNETKFFGLQILCDTINSKWKIMPKEQREAIKNYITSLIISKSSDVLSLEKEKVLITKLSMTLIQILKHDWPKQWPNFITEIVQSSQQNEYLCQTNVKILRLLSEEIFDFSSGQMMKSKAKALKESMCNEFACIYQLCRFIMCNSSNISLLLETFQMLNRFLTWIPIGYIFETDLVRELIAKFFPAPMFRNIIMSCLSELAAIVSPHHEKHICETFKIVINAIQENIPLNTNISLLYPTAKDDEQKFIQTMALFLSTFLQTHTVLLESNNDQDYDLLSLALSYMLSLSEIEDVEIYKMCLDFWEKIVEELYKESPFTASSTYFGSISKSIVPRRSRYNESLSRLRSIIISHMARPEEVTVVQNENGEIVRQPMKDTDAINLYKTCRHVLVCLTHLDAVATEKIMVEKLQNQVNGTEWSIKNLNSLCWAIGSISNCLYEENERRFLILVIKDLLGLCEMKKGKDNKAAVASNIMYIVGQYPKFLMAHWKFLKTVVNKLFEFMHESHDGVQDMACETFLKISQRCRRYFITIQSGEQVPFIEEIIPSVPLIICDLSPSQINIFYEALGWMLESCTDSTTREKLLKSTLDLSNKTWNNIITSIAVDKTILHNIENIVCLSHILQINNSVCRPIGHFFISQLKNIFYETMDLYTLFTANISEMISSNGEIVLQQSLVKSMRVVKKEILNLISTWIEKCEDANIIHEGLLKPIMSIILVDYGLSGPLAREAEVLNLIKVMIEVLKELAIPYILQIFESTFEATLQMIKNNFEDFPDHRLNFYGLVHSITKFSFISLFQLNNVQFKLYMDSIIWAFKHSSRNIEELGLDILSSFLNMLIINDPNLLNDFYKMYYIEVLDHLLSVVTDNSHVSAINKLAAILSHLFQIVERKTITIQLYSASESFNDNISFIKTHITNIIQKAFPHLLPAQINIFVNGLFDLDEQLFNFVEHLREFLVELREFSGDTYDDLFIEERLQALRTAHEHKLKSWSAIPGALSVKELNELNLD